MAVSSDTMRIIFRIDAEFIQKEIGNIDLVLFHFWANVNNVGPEINHN